ncbi:Na(+)/H(+) antiporter subunit B [Parvivirga hydrogeniphila]|uniref:Na(+)/H(+) antiporter subunit B n=1 Tax=Parvivirga hydrogeniphila TaxID=2939460 RepID=UPI002B271837|nr:hydrogenase subunit MbhD domain-containing protein [Parvivirga hydrogeniphila]
MSVEMSRLFDLGLMVLLVLCALAVVRTKDLLAAAIIFSAYSLVMCLVWDHRGAPDVAMTEAAVGAGVTTVLFLSAVSKTVRREK